MRERISRHDAARAGRAGRMGDSAAMRCAFAWCALYSPAIVISAIEQRPAVDRAAPVHVVAERDDAEVHVTQVPGDRDLVHRLRDLAVLDPEAGGAARIVAGHGVDALPHHLGHEQARAELAQQRLRVEHAALHHEVVHAAGVAGRHEPELARGIASPAGSRRARRRPRARGRGSRRPRRRTAPTRARPAGAGARPAKSQSGNTCSPFASSRKLLRRYCAAPPIAPVKCPISPRASSGANSTGALRVDSLPAPSRCTAFSAALRPTDSTSSSARQSRAAVYQ